MCLQSHEPFYAIGLYYDDFHQVTDSEVVTILSHDKDTTTIISGGFLAKHKQEIIDLARLVRVHKRLFLQGSAQSPRWRLA